MTVIRREAPWIFHHCQSSIIVWSQECPIAQNWSPELMNLNWTMNWRGILLKIFPLTSHKPKSFFYFGIFHCTADSMEWTPAQYVTWKEVSTQMSSLINNKFKMNQRACLTNTSNHLWAYLTLKRSKITTVVTRIGLCKQIIFHWRRPPNTWTISWLWMELMT